MVIMAVLHNSEDLTNREPDLIILTTEYKETTYQLPYILLVRVN